MRSIIYRVKFNLRKVRFGIPGGDLVLDIGSGNNPHPRADILCDKFLDNDLHRQGHALATDGRILIQADIENLPFKDKTVDFVIASHILEHVDNPEKAAREISRVGKRGYVETPSAQIELIFRRPEHKWLVRKIDGRLDFVRKTALAGTPSEILRICDELKTMIEKHPEEWWRFYFRTSDHWVVQYPWADSLDVVVHGDAAAVPGEDTAEWAPELARADEMGLANKLLTRVGKAVVDRIYRLQRSKRRRLSDILDLLQCPACRHGNFLAAKGGSLVCSTCGHRYSVDNGVAGLVI